MTRNTSDLVNAEVSARATKPILLLEGDFDSGELCLWSGRGTLTWNSKSWTGAGDLLGVESQGETTGLKATGATFSLSGLSTSILEIAESEDYQGRPVKMWLGFLNGDGSVVSDPVRIFTGRCDVMTEDDQGETCTIQMTAESFLIDLGRARERRYTAEDQRAVYPDDTFFDQVADLQDLEIILE